MFTISWNYYNNPIQKFGNPWFLILCEVTWMIHDCFFLFCDGCSWVPCLFWTVELSTVLQTNPPCPAESSAFQHLWHIWTHSSSDCMTLRSLFSHWGQLRDSNTKKDSNIHWCSRRKHDALRVGGWKLKKKYSVYTMERQYLPHILQDQMLISGAQDL